MRRPHRVITAVALGLLAVSAAQAHFNMLLPQSPSGKREESVTITYQWGHPFEHQLFDAPAPQQVFALAPDGKRTDLTSAVEKVAVPSGEDKATAYRFRYTPAVRGDHVLVLHTPAIWLEEERLFLQDTVKVVYHVQTQKGWDGAVGRGFELVPLTRPYGLQPGMVLQAQVLLAGKPVPGGLVEVERYNATPPKELPPDEQITRTAKADPNGVVTCTLTEPGWWCLTAQRDGGQREHQGKMYPVRQRTTFWVFVDEKVAAPPAK